MDNMDNSFSLKTIFKDYVRGTVKLVQERQLFLYAAQSSFFILTSFVPFMILVVSIGKLLGLDINTFISVVENAAPDFLGSAISALADDLYDSSGTIISLAAISIIWSSAKAVQGIAYGLNNLMGIEEKRNYFVLRYRAILYTLIFIFLLSCAVLFTVYGHNIRDILVIYFNVERTPFLLSVLLMFRYLITFVLLAFFFTVLYSYIPGRGESFRSRIFTGIICAIAWSVFTFLLALYVKLFKAFTLYGSMFMILLWLLWLYICMSIFFVCGMCYPMVNYLFACLGIKLKGGYCKDVPMPEHTKEVSGLGMKLRNEAKKKSKKSKMKRLGKDFLQATAEPARNISRAAKKISNKQRRTANKK